MRTRLDKGKILAVIPQFLGLEDFSPFNDHPASSKNSHCSSEYEFQEGREGVKGLDKNQLLGAAKKRKSNLFSDKSRLKDDCSLPKSIRFQNCGVGGVSTDVDKGKKQWVHIPRPRTNSRSNRIAKIVIRDDLVQQTKKVQEVDSTSSRSYSERSWRAFSNFSLLKGDCSNKNNSDGSLQDGPPLHGPPFLGPSGGSDGPPLEQEEGELMSYKTNSLGQGYVTHKSTTGITIDLIGESESEDPLGHTSLKHTAQGMAFSDNSSHSEECGKTSSSLL
ncbi:hypothetical protein Q3G72_012568 [Acer saccharum]|nr:hypothetical protein Q3G72_012568 [Acer saccharum]